MTVTIDQIADFDKLPQEVQNEIRDAHRLEYRSFHIVQEVLGYHKDKGLVFSLAGGFRFYWPEGKKAELFEVTSYGSDQWQWSLQSGLRPNHKE